MKHNYRVTVIFRSNRETLDEDFCSSHRRVSKVAKSFLKWKSIYHQEVARVNVARK